jgi:hypothetical protein
MDKIKRITAANKFLTKINLIQKHQENQKLFKAKEKERKLGGKRGGFYL